MISEVTDQPQLESFLSKINRKISRHHFKIACVTCEVTGEELLVWLNTRNDNISKAQDVFNPAELEYFQIVMGEIIESDDKSLPLNVCLNLATSLIANLLFKAEAQKTIQKWVKGAYLVNHNGKVYLGARCIHEFASYFRKLGERLNICNLCSEIVFVVRNLRISFVAKLSFYDFQGNTCGTCSNTFHKVCLNTYLRRKKSCPQCKNSWEEASSDL